ncbi:hypothetical protein Are01nite_11890 [Actinoplanes regularis]|nr:hypothetical protein Are01nite_11890 [Actinoplanes regularis]
MSPSSGRAPSAVDAGHADPESCGSAGLQSRSAPVSADTVTRVLSGALLLAAATRRRLRDPAAVPAVPADTRFAAPADAVPATPADTRSVAPADAVPATPADTRSAAPADAAPVEAVPAAPADAVSAVAADARSAVPGRGLGSAPEAAGRLEAFLAAGIGVFLLANDCGHN